MKLTLPVQILLVVVIACLAGVYPMSTSSTWDINVALLTGMALSVLNAVAGYLALRFAIGKSDTIFMKVMLGGIGIRIAGLLGVLVFCILVLHLPAVPLMVSAMAFYALFLVLEVLHIHFTIRDKNVHEG